MKAETKTVRSLCIQKRLHPVEACVLRTLKGREDVGLYAFEHLSSLFSRLLIEPKRLYEKDQSEAAIERLIAAPAWPRYGTRLPSRNLWCAFCTLCAPQGADFAAGMGHPARAGAPWVGFSGLEMARDQALGDVPSRIVRETRFTSQIQ